LELLLGPDLVGAFHLFSLNAKLEVFLNTDIMHNFTKYMTKIIKLLILFSVINLALTKNVSADVLVKESSAKLRTNTSKNLDRRRVVLKKFLKSHNSPLAAHAEEFVSAADKYSLDWRLVAAISGVESTFGKKMPANSYNAYGWANGAYSFKSWEESIAVVSKTLREKYIDKGATNISKIARIYAPPSNTWAWKVRFFMRKIEPLPVEFAL